MIQQGVERCERHTLYMDFSAYMEKCYYHEIEICVTLPVQLALGSCPYVAVNLPSYIAFTGYKQGSCTTQRHLFIKCVLKYVRLRTIYR